MRWRRAALTVTAVWSYVFFLQTARTVWSSALNATAFDSGRKQSDVGTLRELTDEELSVIAWRISCLTHEGVDADVAGRLAAIPQLDLHQAVEMKRNGCPQLLLLRILKENDAD